MVSIPSRRLSGMALSDQLLELQDNEFRRLYWGKADDDVHHAVINVGRCRRRTVATYEIGLGGGLPLKCALSKKLLHEGVYIHADPRPERLGIGLECRPLQAEIKAPFDE